MHTLSRDTFLLGNRSRRKRYSEEENEADCEREMNKNAMRIRQTPSTNYFNSMFLRIMLQTISYASSRTQIRQHEFMCVVVYLGDLSFESMYLS